MIRIFIFTVFLLFSVCFGAVQIAPTRSTLTASFIFPAEPRTNPVILAAKDSLIALHERDSAQTLVYKRNTTGQYEHIVTHPVTNTTSFLSYTATDGQWVSWSSIPLQTSQTVRCELYIPNEDGTISNFTVLDNSVIKFNYGDFLPDGSFIGISTDTLYTYQYVASNWTLINTFNFTVSMAMPTVLAAGPFFQITDTHVITVTKNYAEIHFYERQANNSWSLSDKITIGATKLTAAVWNGDDTVIATFYGDNNEVGVMYLYTRVNGTWSLTSTTTGKDLGLTWLGTRVVSVDANTFIVAAFSQAILLQRNKGQWYLNGDFVGDSSAGSYSGGVAYNSHDIFLGHANGVSTAPLCSVRPVIDYTCDRTALDTCKFKVFDASLVCNYTDQCGQVITNVKSFGIEDYQVEVQLELNRFGTFGTSVNVSFSCPAVSSPSSGPSSATVPFAATPSNRNNGPDSKVTSNTRAVVASSWLLWALCGLLVLY